MKKVNILGTEYTILFDVPESEMPEFSDGCMDQTTKKIKIMKLESDRNSVENLDEYKKNILRHEIIHAFIYESGLWNNSSCGGAWAQNEEMIDWIAIQFSKIQKAFEQAECI